MKISDIDLRLLRVFQTVAEYGGIVKAQAPLGINQPTISSHIANLEKRLNVVLCNRGPKGFSLTPAGKLVLEETTKLHSHLNEYTQRLAEIGESSERRVRIGAIDCLISDPNCPMQSALRSAVSDIEAVDISYGNFDYLDIINELRADRIDIGIVGLDKNIPTGLEACFLYDEVSFLYCSVDHPCAQFTELEEIHSHLKESKISSQSFENKFFDEQWSDLLLTGNNVPTGHIEATAQLVLAGLQIGLMPSHYAKPWVEAGLIQSILPDTFNVISEIHVAYIADKDQNASTMAFISQLKRSIEP